MTITNILGCEKKRLSTTATVLSITLWLSMAANAMDVMTAAEMEALSGRAGVTIAFSDTITTSFTINAMSWGDPDGIGVGLNTGLPGWLKLSGIGGATGSWYIEIPEGTDLTVDVHRVEGGDYTPGAGYGVIQIPDGSTFLALSLTSYTLGFDTSSTVYISLDPSSGTISSSAASTGWIKVDNLKMDRPAAPVTSQMYIWAH